MNYVDDITTTLRRINAFIPMMEGDERKRLAEYLRSANVALGELLARLEKGN
jgi:hypothetical protein